MVRRLPSVPEPQTVTPLLNPTSIAATLGIASKTVLRYPYDELCGIALLTEEHDGWACQCYCFKYTHTLSYNYYLAGNTESYNMK